jgi:hypothetical protein
MFTHLLEELTHRSCLRTLGHNPTEQEMWRFMAQVGYMKGGKDNVSHRRRSTNLFVFKVTQRNFVTAIVPVEGPFLLLSGGGGGAGTSFVPFLNLV